MDYAPEPRNVVHVIPEPWPSEEDYRVWNAIDSPSDTPSNSNHDQRQRSGSEPPSKKSKGAALDSASSGNSNSNFRAKAIGKMFFKTKLCCKFRAGTCPYVTNCNLAHSVDELGRPPPNWQEIVSAADDEEREEFQIPSVGSAGFTDNPQRSYKGRHCKKFYTEEGCPYGDTCTFLHDEQSKNRESVAISLGPGGYSGGGGSNSNAGASATGAGAGAGPGSSVKPSNWKTRICNKWELTGYCPFGSKCHFAHGSAELHRYGGGLLEQEARDAGEVSSDPKQGGGGGGGVPPKAPTDNVVSTANSAPHMDVYHAGVPLQSQRTAIILQRPGQRVHRKWKGPDKISRIYGDWIDDIE